MSVFNSARKATRIAMVAIALTGAALATAPAQAADSTAFRFTFNTGNGVSFSIGSNLKSRPAQKVCLTQSRVMSGLRSQGYRNARITGQRGGQMLVKADKGRLAYDLRVDRCSGNIVVAQRSSNRSGGPGHHGGGFGHRFH